MPELEAVIGLEVHAQLRTRSKIFCGCSVLYGAPPNTQTCPTCLGHPGSLPVLNEKAVELAVRGALALGCTVNTRSVFARKNYFYPDLPKGYQISQYEEPLASGGGIQVEIGGEAKRIGLARLHLEEDAGKLIHEGMPDSDRATYVDLNRSGVPLVEIVSRPEIETSEEAYLFLQRLRSILRYTGVCGANLEEGSLRCDANISIRPRGSADFGPRTELKNLNSFRNVERALKFEIERQVGIDSSGGEVAQETVLWDAAAGETRVMRGKEGAHDYRYFPEPNLPPLTLDPAWIESVRATLPELPAERKRRLAHRYALAEAEAHLLTLERGLADYYEEVAGLSGDPKAAAHFVLNDLLREQKNAKRDESDIPLPAAHLAELVRLVGSCAISLSAARRLFGELYRTGRPPGDLVRERGLEQVSDEKVLRDVVREVMERNPGPLHQYRAGKASLFDYFVGQVLRASGGKANPAVVNRLLQEMLG